MTHTTHDQPALISELTHRLIQVDDPHQHVTTLNGFCQGHLCVGRFAMLTYKHRVETGQKIVLRKGGCARGCIGTWVQLLANRTASILGSRCFTIRRAVESFSCVACTQHERSLRCTRNQPAPCLTLTLISATCLKRLAVNVAATSTARVELGVTG